MLLVVLGAGASFDFSRGYPAGQSIDPLAWRPPLTDSLVADCAHNRDLLNAVPGRAASSLITEVRRRLSLSSAPTLESILDDLSKSNGLRARELLAFRMYLQALLRKCSSEGIDEVAGDTNHALLVRHLEMWRKPRNEPVLYVTFNYDSILEEALTSDLGWQPGGIESYLERDEFQLFKLHGSWNWSQITDVECHYPGGDGGDDDPELRRALLDNAAAFDGKEYGTIQVTGNTDWQRFTARVRWQETRRSVWALPALAVPLGSKARFTCPQSHVDILARYLPKIDRILAIGWKAGEPAFVDLLRHAKPDTVLRVVDPSEQVNLNMVRNLMRKGVPLKPRRVTRPVRPMTFSEFVRDELQEYLADL